MGYTLVYGVLRLINFAHSEIFMIGTFGALFATKWLGITPDHGAERTGIALVGVLLLSAVVGMAVSGVAAVILERVAYRPLRRRRATRLAALISAIGASLALQEAFALWRGRNGEGYPRVLAKTNLASFHGATISVDKVLAFVAALLMMLALDRFVGLTKVGRGIRAVAQDPESASLMGVDIDRIITITFLLGGIMAGLAGMLYMVRVEITSYSVGALLGIKAFTAAVLGGIGNLRGALLGGLALGVMENYGGAIFGSQWKDVISFALLVVVLIVRPTGLLGERLGKARV